MPGARDTVVNRTYLHTNMEELTFSGENRKRNNIDKQINI